MSLICFPAPLAKKIKTSSFEVSGSSLLSCLEQVSARFPNIKPYLFSDNDLAPFTKIFINQIDADSISGLNTFINPDDEIQVVMAVSGG